MTNLAGSYCVSIDLQLHKLGLQLENKKKNPTSIYLKKGFMLTRDGILGKFPKTPKEALFLVFMGHVIHSSVGTFSRGDDVQ